MLQDEITRDNALHDIDPINWPMKFSQKFSQKISQKSSQHLSRAVWKELTMYSWWKHVAVNKYDGISMVAWHGYNRK